MTIAKLKQQCFVILYFNTLHLCPKCCIIKFQFSHCFCCHTLQPFFFDASYMNTSVLSPAAPISDLSILTFL